MGYLIRVKGSGINPAPIVQNTRNHFLQKPTDVRTYPVPRLNLDASYRHRHREDSVLQTATKSAARRRGGEPVFFQFELTRRRNRVRHGL